MNRSSSRGIRATLVATIAVAALVLTGCAAGSGSSTSAPASASASKVGPASLKTITPGKLTIATGQPAYSPWVENDDPASGKGFEAAVAYAVAKQLGYAASDVVWKRSTFDSAIAPGPKDWDLNLQQFSITAERKKAVDFSSPYYVTNQAVVTTASSKAASATSLAALTSLKFGVQVGTTSLATVQNVIKPTTAPSIFNSSQDVFQALKNKQVDAIVTDLPTAFYLAAAELDNGKVVGQFPPSNGGDEYGFVLPKGSALTTPVSAAVDALRTAGTLDQLQQKWLSDTVNVPVFK